jgi:hypothetical protein
MAKSKPAKPSTGFKHFKSFVKKKKLELAAALAFFCLPWVLNFTVSYELGLLVVIIEIAVLMFYRHQEGYALNPVK